MFEPFGGYKLTEIKVLLAESDSKHEFAPIVKVYIPFTQPLR